MHPLIVNDTWFSSNSSVDRIMKSVQSVFSSARSAGNLVAPGFVDQDIPDAFPEVFPVSGKGLGAFLLYIAAFGLHDFIKRSGHV